MKKVYLAALSIGVLSMVNAQTTAPKAYLPFEKQTVENEVRPMMSSDRAGGDLIYGLDFSDLTDVTTPTDAMGHAWFIDNALTASMDGYINIIASPTASNDFAGFDGIQYLLAGSVEPQDAFVQWGPLDMTGETSAILTFYQAHRAFNSDRCLVEISNDGTSWTTFEINEEHETNGPTYQEQISINVSSLLASGTETTFYVRFRWEELSGDDGFGSGYGWMVDDVQLVEPYANNVGLTANYFRSGLGVSYVEGLEYYKVSQDQLTEISFIGEVENFGAGTQVNTKLNVDITGAGTFSGTSTPADLPIAATDSVTASTTFTPSANGMYNVTWFFDSDGAEEVTDNDSAYDVFEVHPYLYSRANGIQTGSISNVTSNTDQPMSIGNEMNIFADGVIGAVDIMLGTDATAADGGIVYAAIYKYDGTTFSYEAQTNDYDVLSSDIGAVKTLYFSSDVNVVAGDIILVVVGHYGAPEVEFGMAQNTTEGSVLGTVSDGSLFTLTSPQAIMIDVHMRSYVGLEEGASAFEIGQNIPNPFDGTSVINYSLEEASNVAIEIMDVTGKIVKVINQGTQTAGNYQVVLDANDYAEGTYFYTFTIGEKQVTKRMVITK